MVFEFSYDIGLDIVPAGGADNRRLEAGGYELVILAEGLRSGEVDADALFGNSLWRGTDILARQHQFDAVACEFFFDHVAHPAIAAYNDFHNFTKLEKNAIMESI